MGPGTGAGEGTNLSTVHGLSSQLAMVAYDGGSLGGGYRLPNFGLWPVCNAPPACDNGGIVQNISLPAHIAALTSAVAELIPDPLATGVLALDYEGWQPVWDELLGAQYKRFSEDLVRTAHPSWAAAAVTAEAARQFESAAEAFYTATFTTLRKLRPHIQLSHHAYPVLVCYYNPAMRAHNDALLWFYEQLDVIMPSVYLQSVGPTSSYPCAADEQTLLRQVMAEAGRIAEQVGAARAATANPAPGPARLPRASPVLPITWLRTEIHGDNRLLNSSYFDIELFTPFEFPYTVGVQIWGMEAYTWAGDDAKDGGNCSTAEAPGPCDKGINAVMAEYGAAAIDAFVSERCDCAERQCNSHGVCYGQRGKPLNCYCEADWGDSDCSKLLNITPPSPSPPPPPPVVPPPATAVVCPDGLAWCPAGNTCAQSSLGVWVCCPHPHATICSSRRCCPANTTCSPPACHGRVCVEEFCLPKAVPVSLKVDDELAQAEFSLGAYIANPAQHATLVVVRHTGEAPSWPALTVVLSLYDRVGGAAPPGFLGQSLLVPRGQRGGRMSISLRGWPSAEYTANISISTTGQTQNLVRWLRVESDPPLPPPGPISSTLDLAGAMAWPDEYHHKAFEMTFVDDHSIAQKGGMPLTRRVHRGTPIRITNAQFDAGSGFVHEHQSSNLVSEGAGLALNISVTWGGGDGAAGPLFTCKGTPFEQCHFYACRCEDAATGCDTDNWTCRRSSPPPAVQRKRTDASTEYRFFDAAVDGPIALAEVKLVFSGYHRTMWSKINITAMSTWATWSPQGKGVTLLLSKEPLTVNRVPRLGEPGTWRDTNDNFGGQWLVRRGNITTLYCE